MRNIDRFESIIGKIHEMSANYFDETIPVTDMMFHSIDRMWISGKEVENATLPVSHSICCKCKEKLLAEADEALQCYHETQQITERR